MVLCRFFSVALFLLLLSNVVFGAQRSRKRRVHRATHATVTARATTMRTARVRPARYVPTIPSRTGPVVRGGPWTEPTYADSTEGDYVDGEDLDVRSAAVEALGPYNGSVLVVDPNGGRILSMVNQKLALGGGFQPCSTVKVSVALAALMEGLIEPPAAARSKSGMNLTWALAHSNNTYFANLGTRLGFARVSHYARLFGYGEKAGLDISGERPGRFPSAPPRNGGVGMLTSFGEEISQTPLQLAALISALANGGTLYYLQYPRTPMEIAGFTPRVKRRLDIQECIPAVKPGMLGAVEFGTARRAQQDAPIAGKTGTCTDGHTHMGWFGSFNDQGRKLVVVVMLTGGRPAVGPVAAGIAGQVYRNLAQRRFLSPDAGPAPALVSTPACCTR